MPEKTNQTAPAWRSLYPFDSHYVDLDGHRYHYLDEGRGDTLLLVHGNPTWSFYWRNLVLALRERYRVVVVDHMGCGLSDKPREYHYRLSQHIQNLGRLVRELDLRAITLLAHDWGGAIGLGEAVAEPERFARFVMFNTAAFRSQRIPLRISVCRTPVLGRLAVQGLNAFARAAIHMAVTKHERMTPAVRQGLLAPYDSWSHRRAVEEFVLDIPLNDKHPSYATLRGIEERLPSLGQRPWQFIWGMQDWCFTPHFLERFLELIPKPAEVHRLEDCGHYVIEDAHERIVPLVENFLAANPIGPSTAQRR